MNTQILLDQYFEMAFSAPNGIKRLRELILTLAMQGKLVPQDSTDQPARELLQEIEAEKQRLIKAGKIKKQKPLPPIQPEEIPYDLPESWEWVRIRNICYDFGQKQPDKQFTYIDVGCIDNKNGIIGNDFQVLRPEEAPSRARKIVKQGTVIYSTVRPYLLNIAIINKEYQHETIASTAFAILHPFLGVNNHFIYSYLRSPIFIRYVEDQMKGVAYPAINDGSFFQGLFPLPPLAEQKRIVEKIESLMAQCDELEKRQQEREQKRILVHTSAVQKLLNAPEEKTFGEAWQFIKQNFGELYAVKENVSELRKAILQLAVMGKLVPQDPNDPPASELLKEITAEKQRLIKEGKIKKQKPLPKITADEIFYGLPDSWEWCVLRQISLTIDYGTSQKTCNDSSKIPVYRMGNIVNGRLIDINLKYIDPNIDDLPRLFLQKNDILFNRTNSYELVGKSALYDGEDNTKTFASYLIRIQLEQKNVFPRFVNLAMNAPYFRETQIEPEITQQCGQANFNGTKLSETLIPLPPLLEQHRIVAKVDALMALCDQLENQIDQQTAKQTQLLEAVMAGI